MQVLRTGTISGVHWDVLYSPPEYKSFLLFWTRQIRPARIVSVIMGCDTKEHKNISEAITYAMAEAHRQANQ